MLCRDLDNAIARRDVEFIPAEDLWKFVNATARDQYRVMVVIDGEGHGAPNSWLRLSSIVLYDITAALSSKSSRT